MNKYQALLSKKRVWTPVKPERFTLPDEAREAVGRCLSLRFLELPVGEFIRDAGKGRWRQRCWSWYWFVLRRLR